MIDIEGQIAEATQFYREAEDEFQLRHYHLVVGNLMYALHILEEIGEDDHDLVGEIYYLLARSHLELKNLDKVYSYWDSCYFFYLERDLYKLCELQNMKGIIATRDGKDKQAIRSYEKILQLLKDDRSEQAWPILTRSYFNLANCYIRKGQYDLARKFYLKAYRAQGKWENPALKGKILMGLGVTYQYDHQDSLTLRCYKKALQYIKPTNYVTYGRLLHNLGDLHLQLGMVEEARDFYEESIKEEHYLKLDRGRVVSSLRGLAYTFVNADVQKVKAYSMKAMELLLERDVTKFTPMEEKDLAHIFKLLCYWMYQERKLDECRLYLAQARAIFRKQGLSSELDKLDNLAEKLR